MKKVIHIFLCLCAGFLGAGHLSAQQMRSAYFLEGYTYRYKMNPALASARGYFSFPAIGQVNIGAESNLGLSSIIYPTENGQLTTFLNSAIPAETMLKAIKDNNRISVNVSTPVLSFGWWSRKTFHSIDLSARMLGDFSIPGDLFRFLKGCPSVDRNRPDVYDLKKTGANVDGFVELGYGFSTSIKDRARFGARFKFLVGAAHAQLQAEKFLVTAQEDQWSIDSKVNLQASQLIDLGIDENNAPTYAINPDALLSDPKNTLSFGGAIDLGFSVDFLKYLTLSASVLDLGFIVVPCMTRISTSGEPWIYTGLGEDIGINDSGSMNDQLNVVLDGLSGIAKFTEEDLLPKKTKMLSMTVNTGLEFRMPFWQRMSIGALGTIHLNGIHRWMEGRFSLNMNLTRWLGLSGNYAISDFGHSAGAIMSIHARGFNLFIATDSVLPFTELAEIASPIYIPVGPLNTTVSFGLNFTIGKYRGRIADKDMN